MVKNWQNPAEKRKIVRIKNRLVPNRAVYAKSRTYEVSTSIYSVPTLYTLYNTKIALLSSRTKAAPALLYYAGNKARFVKKQLLKFCYRTNLSNKFLTCT